MNSYSFNGEAGATYEKGKEEVTQQVISQPIITRRLVAQPIIRKKIVRTPIIRRKIVSRPVITKRIQKEAKVETKNFPQEKEIIVPAQVTIVESSIQPTYHTVEKKLNVADGETKFKKLKPIVEATKRTFKRKVKKV